MLTRLTNRKLDSLYKDLELPITMMKRLSAYVFNADSKKAIHPITDNKR